MMIPGSNLLNTAMRVIAKQSFSYYAFLKRITNAIGYDVNVYLSPITLQGSIQAVPRNLYEKYGLNFQNNYVFCYVPNDIQDIARDRSSDIIVYSTQQFQVLSDTRWFPIDGWTAFIAVQIPAKAIISTVTPPANGTYGSGTHIDFTMAYSNTVVVTGTPRLILTAGSHTRYANYLSGSGTTALIFRYSLVSGDVAPSGISVSGIVDLNSGTIITSTVPANGGFVAPDLTGVIFNYA